MLTPAEKQEDYVLNSAGFDVCFMVQRFCDLSGVVLTSSIRRELQVQSSLGRDVVLVGPDIENIIPKVKYTNIMDYAEGMYYYAQVKF